MAVKPYDAKEVYVIFGGSRLEGLAEGTFITVTPLNPDYTYQRNTDGGGTRSASNDRAATMTLVLAQTSDSNDVLTGLHNTDRDTPGGVLSDFMVKDNLGRTLVSAETAWINQFPDVELGQESTTRTWEFGTDNMVWFVGGN